ncbi:glycosyltransferase family protein [Porticoccaceae bacterium LTM1]|nr:glycosyltransferase family protein [Porticoccaceae bacterium LTM1]
MKILYGVQATGNGHITRARAMAPALKEADLEVDFLFSGRSRDKLFDMEPFGDFRSRDGLTFCTREGKIALLPTIRKIKPARFIREVRELDVSEYDLILTDFEPVTAWAGKLAGKQVVGLGHQYAFLHPIPQHRGNPLGRLVTRFFAPADVRLGLHWHHFDRAILPPIAPVEIIPTKIEEDLYLVYLPFESLRAIEEMLKYFPQYRFAIFHPEASDRDDDNLMYRAPSRDGFQEVLAKAAGVIGNAGFGLASEALQWGKKLLVKPLAGQPEQYSNALALELLELAQAMEHLDRIALRHWLEYWRARQVRYPDVANAVAQWIAKGDFSDTQQLATKLWQQSSCPDSGQFAENLLGEWLYLPDF